MAVRIRLTRTGKKNAPSYRVVVADSRSPRDGKFIEIVGNYNPRLKEETIELDKVDAWIAKGAQPSDTVNAIINRVRAGRKLEVAAPKNINVAPKKAAPAPAEEAPVAEETVAAE